MITKENEDRYYAFHKRFVHNHELIEKNVKDLIFLTADCSLFIHQVNDQEKALFDLKNEFPALNFSTNDKPEKVRLILGDIGIFYQSMYKYTDDMVAVRNATERFATKVLALKEILIQDATTDKQADEILIEFEENVEALSMQLKERLNDYDKIVAAHILLKQRHLALME